jgi:hypothetical protein
MKTAACSAGAGVPLRRIDQLFCGLFGVEVLPFRKHQVETLDLDLVVFDLVPQFFRIGRQLRGTGEVKLLQPLWLMSITWALASLACLKAPPYSRRYSGLKGGGRRRARRLPALFFYGVQKWIGPRTSR